MAIGSQDARELELLFSVSTHTVTDVFHAFIVEFGTWNTIFSPTLQVKFKKNIQAFKGNE